jgi:hypothetical protein
MPAARAAAIPPRCRNVRRVRSGVFVVVVFIVTISVGGGGAVWRAEIGGSFLIETKLALPP